MTRKFLTGVFSGGKVHQAELRAVELEPGALRAADARVRARVGFEGGRSQEEKVFSRPQERRRHRYYTASPPAIGSRAAYILPPLLRLVLAL
eukprot:914936-Prorocentrum_minimum.AAC.1